MIQENAILFYIILTLLSEERCKIQPHNSFWGPKSELTSGIQKCYVIAINLCL